MVVVAANLFIAQSNTWISHIVSIASSSDFGDIIAKRDIRGRLYQAFEAISVVSLA
jgi:hypothetical protein